MKLHPLIQRIVDDLNDRRGLHLSSLDVEVYNELTGTWHAWAVEHDRERDRPLPEIGVLDR